MKFFKFILLIVLFSNYLSHAQNQKSLLDSSYNYLFKKYYHLKPSDTLQSLFFAEKYFEKAKKEENIKELILGKDYVTDFIGVKADYISFIDSIIYVSKQNPNKIFPAFAYAKKAGFYLLKEEIDKSLENYLLMLKYGKLYNNIDYIYEAKLRIGMIRNRLGNNKEAIKYNLDVYNYYNNNEEKENERLFFSVLLNLSINYLKREIIDSASFYNKKALLLAKKVKNHRMIYYSLYRQGQIEYKKNNFSLAIDYLESSTDSLIKDTSYQSASVAMSYTANSYKRLGNKNKAVKMFLKLDSLVSKHSIVHESQKATYQYLIEYYKSKKNLKKQLFYLEKLINIDSILNNRTNKVKINLYEKYDKPKLIAERDRIVKELEEELSNSNIIKYSALSSSGIILLLFLYQYRRRKELRKRFEEISKEREVSLKSNTKKSNERPDIPEEVFEKIINGLQDFENKKHFIDSEMKLSVLADKIGTNSNYLSKVINYEKGLNFSQYLNEVRINHTLELLNTDVKIRKYSIKGIAEEVGYKNAESFSNAFHRKTGLKPSYYIKQLEKSSS